MRGDSERDRSMQRALRRSFDKVSAPARSDECVDGETLAAWASGALQSAEAVTIERHVADCARCQALVATFARITPPEPVSESLWQRWHLRWLVPIATAATAVAFWIAVPGDQMRSETEQLAVQFEVREEAPQARAESNVPLPSRPTVIAERPARDADLQKQSQSTANPSDTRTRERNVIPGQRADERSLERRDQVAALPPPPTIAPEPSASARVAPSPQATADKPASARAAPSPQATADKPAAPPAPEPLTAPAAPALREAPASAPAVPSLGATAGKPAARAESPPPSTSTAAASPPVSPVPTSPRSTETLERDRLAAGSAADVARHGIVPVEIVSPNPSSRWRVVGRRQVERSTDGGATWARLGVTPTNDLTAGSAPAATVAWIVGRGGTVFLTTDGARFVRIPFVTAVDLVSVAATSDQAATVVTADGRAFRTTNRGATWTPTR